MGCVGGIILPPWLVDGDSTGDGASTLGLDSVRPPVLQSLQDDAEQRHADRPDAHLPILRDLEHCESFEDFKKLFRRGYTGRHKPWLSHMVFQRLLARKTPIETMLRFLEDAEFNGREARNLIQLLAHQLQKAWPNPKEIETLSNWIQTRIALGLLPFSHIPPLLKIIDCPSNTGQTGVFRQEFYAKVIEGVRQCKICGSWKAKEQLLNTILVFISRGNILPEFETLGWKMIGASSTVCGFMNEGIDSFVSHWILAQHSPHSSADSEADFAKGIVSALEIIRTFPDHIAEVCIKCISKTLIKRIETLDPTTNGYNNEVSSERSMYLEQLTKWWSLLQNCELLSRLQRRPGWRILERTLGSQEGDVLATYLRLMDESSKCLFFIRHCYRLELNGKDHLEPGECAGFRALAEAQFKDICDEHPHRAPFTNLLLSFRLAKDRGVRNIQKLSEIIRSLRTCGTPIALATARSIAHMHLDERLMIREIDYFLERNQPRVAYRLFQSFPTLSLEHVPALAEAMVANPKLCTHAALYYRHRRQKWLNQGKPSDKYPQYLVHLRAQLLNSMAYAYSHSPHPPSISFRKVYKCYLALQTDQLPVTAEFTKALTFAGVVRYLKQGAWVSTERYNKIWSLVKEVEGQKVADRLDDLVFFWRGKVLDQNMYRKRKERALALPHGSLLTEEQLELQKAKDMRQSGLSPRKNRRQRMHWYKEHRIPRQYDPLRAGD